VRSLPPLPLLHAAVFLSSFDRLVIAPLLLVIARDLDVPLSAVTATATAYFVGYGLMQVVWGVVSDHLGRVRTMRLALLLGALACVATAFTAGLEALVLVRLVAGCCFAAIVPGALIYVGDTVPIQVRHAPLTDVMTATALGTAMATVVGAAIAELFSWRAAFVVPGVFVLAVVVLMRRLPEPRAHAPRTGSALAPLLIVLRDRWALVVLLIGFVEGMVLLGVLNYLPAALQVHGMGTTLSGAVTAGYGVAVIVFSWLVKRLSRRTSSARLIAVGGASGVLAYVAFVLDQVLVGVFAGSVLLAGAWAFMHSTVQKWSTEVVPHARAATVGMFASTLFLGSAVWTAFGAGFAADHDFRGYFVVGAGVALVLAVGAFLAWRRYDRSQAEPDAPSP
jgi:MFS transporter, YNFM family, putative membrane transport protein